MCALQDRLLQSREKLSAPDEHLRTIKEKAARRVTAMRKEKELQDLFAKYDVDCDDQLGRQEIAELAKGEFDLAEPSEEFLQRVISTLVSPGAAGVTYEKFGRLRQMLAIERSQVKARQKRADEEERRRRQAEEEERRIRERTDRADRALLMLMEAAVALEAAEQGVPAAERKARPLAAPAGLGSEELQAAGDEIEACLASGCSTLGPARVQLDEALAILGEDCGQRVLEVEEVDAVREASEVKARLVPLEARVGRLKKAARAAKDRAKRKREEEDKNKKEKKNFSRLEQMYQEAEEGDSDDDW